MLALVVDLFTPGVPSLDRSPSQLSLAAAFAAQAEVTNEWLARPGVVGTAVGFSGSGQAVVKVYITALGVAALPQSVAGVPVSVEVTGRFVSLGDPPIGASLNEDAEVDPKAGFPRPVPIGVSTGHPDVTAGTIGARVTDGNRIFLATWGPAEARKAGGEFGELFLGREESLGNLVNVVFDVETRALASWGFSEK